VAKFDRLVFADDGRVIIVDWKTGQRRPDLDQLYASWQTVVYRYVMVEGGHCLNGGIAVVPNQVLLIYWHAAYPNLLEPLGYSQAEHEEAHRRLEAIVEEILSLENEADFHKTEEVSLCQRCEYRSFCARGRVAGDEWEIRDEDLDFEILPEAEY